MPGFETPNSHKIYCVFKDKDKEDILVSEETCNALRSYGDNDTVTIEANGRILFEGKRREIREFKHVYPREDKTPDEYKLFSDEFVRERKKRDEYWNKYKLTMSPTQRDEVWSIIVARWGKTYDLARKASFGDAWKAYFRGMFQIIALEVAGYKDGISSKEGVLNSWEGKFEIPEMRGNVEMYRNFINS